MDDSEIMHDSPITRELWFYLIRKVNHRTVDKFERGSGFFNLSDIADDLHWYVGYRKMKYSKSQLTKALRRLNERNMIETTKATRGIFVTVCKYAHYQDPNNYEGNDEGTAKETRRSKGASTKNKNDKNERIIDTSSLRSEVLSTDVDPSEEKPKSLNIDFEGIKKYWNENTSLPKVDKITETRKKAIRARWKEHGRDAVALVMKKTFASKYLNGNNDRNWSGSFDWIFKPTNFVKIIEGNYDNERFKEHTNGKRISTAEQAKLQAESNTRNLAERIMQEVNQRGNA